MKPALFLRLALSALVVSACSVEASDASEPGEAVGESEDAVTGARPIDPIDVGNAWTYDVTVLGWYPICSSGRHTATALEAVRVGGKNGVRVQSLCDRAGTYVYAAEGDRVWSWYAGAWRRSLDAPVRAGHAWSDDYFDYTWERVGTVTVPAGTFKSCWSAKKLTRYPSYTVFCRGVGPVHWHYEDGFGNGYDAVLRSKNF